MYKLPSLTAEQESQINKALVPTPSDQILAEKFGLQIKRRDMQTLKGLNWLNDEAWNYLFEFSPLSLKRKFCYVMYFLFSGSQLLYEFNNGKRKKR